MSKIAGEINAEMMHPKVIHEQRKALFAEMVRKTGSQQSVLDRLLQEIQFLRDHEGGPMDEEVIDILRGKVAELEAENTLHKSAMDKLDDCALAAYQAGAASRNAEIERLRNELSDAIDCKSGTGPTALSMVISELDQLREQVAVLREALKEAVEDYSDRFDMSSQSTNPGIKWVVKQGKEALAATEPKP